jgi:glycosyltransferase involved in cell wall biosynthesis
MKDNYMTQQYLVSIIVPVYNGEKFITKCLSSLQQQTYTNLEIIIINDGSTDNSKNIIKEFLNDNRLIFINSINKGVSSARNIGIENSKGELIFFIDADDTLNQNSIELLVNEYDNHKADITIGNFVKVKADGFASSGHENTFSENRLMDKPEILQYTKKYLTTSYTDLLFNHCWAKLYKTSIIKENSILFDVTLHGMEDIEFNFQLLCYTKSIYYVHDIIYNYLVGATTSQSTQCVFKENQIENFKKVFYTIEKYLIKNNKNNFFDIEKEIGHFYITNIVTHVLRICSIHKKSNSQEIYKMLYDIVHNKAIIRNIRYYSPKGNESIILGILIRFKLISLLLIIGKYKYFKVRTTTYKELLRSLFQ